MTFEIKGTKKGMKIYKIKKIDLIFNRTKVKACKCVCGNVDFGNLIILEEKPFKFKCKKFKYTTKRIQPETIIAKKKLHELSNILHIRKSFYHSIESNPGKLYLCA